MELWENNRMHSGRIPLWNPFFFSIPRRTDVHQKKRKSGEKPLEKKFFCAIMYSWWSSGIDARSVRRQPRSATRSSSGKGIKTTVLQKKE